jgi:hypothetical protein
MVKVMPVSRGFRRSTFAGRFFRRVVLAFTLGSVLPGCESCSEKRLIRNTYIQGIEYKAGSDVSFHENGKIKRVDLIADTAIQGTIYRAGRRMEFDESGKVKKD